MADGAEQRPPSAPVPPRTTAKSVETRARVVQGALSALQLHGLADTTTRRIAAEAGLRLATLHYHFRNKEAMLLAVLDVLTGELISILCSERRHPEPLDKRVRAVVRMAWAYALRTRAKQIVQYELTLHALRTPGAQWLAARQYDGYVEAYGVALGQDVVPPLVPEQAMRLARFILAGLDGLILQLLAGRSEDDLAPAVDMLIIAAQAAAPCWECSDGEQRVAPLWRHHRETFRIAVAEQ